MGVETVQNRKRFHLEVPHGYTIMVILMILVTLLTWIVPSGEFAREIIDLPDGSTREVTIAGTYTPVDKVYVNEDGDTIDLRQNLFDFLMAPVRGIEGAVEVIAFVLIVGGSFGIITRTEAITAGLMRVTRKLKNRDILIIPIMMVLFSIGGTTFGMAEETLPFYLIFLPIVMGMGYDSITAFMIVFLGARTGYMAATINPFNVLVSQGILGITGNPLLWLRLVAWIVCTAVAIGFVMFYARRVKRNPESSITYKDDLEKRKEYELDSKELDMPFTGRHKAILIVFGLGLALIVWGLVTQGWYMNELSAVFFAIGLFSGMIGGLSEKAMAKSFVNGMADFVFAAVIIGFARAILVIAQDGMIIDTILNALATGLAGVSPVVYALMLILILFLLSFLVPSSSGLAALTMPILGPLTVMMGFNPECAVTALCMSAALACTVAPTSGVVMGSLGMCKINLVQWAKVGWKYMILMGVLTIVFTVISSLIPA